MFEKLKEIMVETLNVNEEEVSLESSLNDDLGIDSLDAVELIMELEDAFEIKVEESEAKKFITVKNIIEFIELKKS